jgi:hypothetical protein
LTVVDFFMAEKNKTPGGMARGWERIALEGKLTPFLRARARSR